MSTSFRRLPLTALFLLLVTGACNRGPGADGQAERVVCVSKQLNEFMFAIGAQNLLVGKDLTSIYPPAILKITSVGYHRALSAEGIISLRPTLFLTDGNFGPAEVGTQLEKVGIPILTLQPGTTVEGAEALLTTLGKRFHREATADSVLRVWKAGMDSVLADTARWVGVKKPRVLIMHFGQLANDYLALGRGGLADHLLHWAGAVNAVDSTNYMTRLTPELIAKMAPDIIVATDVGFDRYGSAQKFATMPGVSLTPAAKTGRIYRIEETDVMYFGPRTPAAVRRLTGFFHPAATTP
ncbi:MAG: heme/hemin ABC transporter substrate-binding protein [Gemmatimonadaceae bacterium]